MPSTVTREDIAAGLAAIGIARGETMMVHSSLSSFGRVEGGPQAVVQALLDVLGPEGTLIVPTFSRYLQGDERVWNRETTPSQVGIISETARTWPGAIRSNHAAHPLAAIGPNAELLCRTPHKTGFGPDSPFRTMVERNIRYLMMGVTYSSATLFHLLEAEAEVPYRHLEERKCTTVIDGVVDESASAWEWTRETAAINDFMVLGHELEVRGLVCKGRIGDAEQLLFRAGDAYRVGMEKMAEDVLYLLTEESKKHWR